MCTKILKKESSSRALPLFMMLIGLIFMAQNCRAMDKEKGEDAPLLSRDDSSINGNEVLLGDDAEDKRPRKKQSQTMPLSSILLSSDTCFNPIEEVLIDLNSSLLKKPDMTKVQTQMDYIADFIILHRNGQKSFKRLQEKYLKEASEVSVPIEGLEELQKYLEGKSWDAISKSPTFQSYLKECRLQSEGLIGLFEKIIAERALLRDQNDSLQQRNKVLVKFCEQHSKEERSEPEEEVEVVRENELDDTHETIKTLQRDKSMLLYVAVPISFFVGAVLGGVGSGLFVYYYVCGGH